MTTTRPVTSGTVDLGLSGAVVLVTGGARGVGAGIASVLAGLGAVPVICGRTAPGAGNEVSEPNQPRPAPHEFHACDVRDSDAVATMIAAIVEKHGRLDGVVNNAGGSPFALAADASDNFARKIIELNLVAPLVVARAAHAVMAGQDGGGAIVNVSSVSGHRPSPGTSAYGASKAGLDNLTESLAVEWAPTVRLNSVVCGPIETELSHLHYGDADGVAAVGATIPMGRLASPADVGNAVAFLLSPLAAYITGSTLTLHGGGEKPAFLDAANADNSV
ncbi:MAG TPA: SDR family oxidoreductase [Gordonia sp. (in: high G+C Gram-positive bacteria)]|uniref:SDR family oxidoreductase n=1 Tax=unclassified Gordonia (in: high G+C Gram-positive bacteria) TaxID=2657482 RepID=UPI000FA308D0|nr:MULTISPECIES: SDR family oxidoreductase [unclassified Gordonia (in: high G+C Gram-positive bacteria)]RUP41252.1 MAG: SDR family oxidoreductase [Gordonia sp. (in: high G+C Gram-positive bacteria)]HNP55544.1 SDR family oxidoreductase [Gordonia sp. (in: high G+C Gram-positive bacteria)]HRC51013.1 SDR family oxidoreductase [Gordonia sp. (in: high G+C Gram-positive bacteria)]